MKSKNQMDKINLKMMYIFNNMSCKYIEVKREDKSEPYLSVQMRPLVRVVKMSNKKISIGAKPTTKITPETADKWVEESRT